MKKFIALTAFLFVLTVGSALASCPEIDGKFTYTCTILRDVDAEFGDVLEVNGAMHVQQAGCDAYRFHNPNTNVSEELLLSDKTGKVQGKIKKSTSDVIKFKTIESRGALKAWVTKGIIRKKHDGFTLDGRERSRVLAIFGSKHSKFDCRFKRAE